MLRKSPGERDVSQGWRQADTLLTEEKVSQVPGVVVEDGLEIFHELLQDGLHHHPVMVDGLSRPHHHPALSVGAELRHEAALQS